MEAIKPSNNQYSAGIIGQLIWHQLNVKTTSRQYKSATLNARATSCQRRTEPRRTTTRNIRFPNQMIEQINIALEQRGPGISHVVIEACRRRLTSEKESIYIN